LTGSLAAEDFAPEQRQPGQGRRAAALPEPDGSFIDR
jgi:hypothetical protein